MSFLKQSTVATVIVGPCLDSSGVEFTTLVLADLNISKNGGTPAAITSGTLTHVANGWYTLAFATGNVDTPGRLDVTCVLSTKQIPPARFTVLLPSVFDALITNAANATGGLIAATAAVSTAAGHIGSTGGALAVSSGKVAATIAAGDIAADAITAASVKADAVTKVQSGLSTYAGGPVDSVTGSVGSVAGNVSGSVGSISGVTFPENFSSLAIDVTGRVNAFLIGILTSVFTEGAVGRIANAFKTFFNVATPVATAASVDQTGDSYGRIGNTGSGLTSLAQASAWTGTRAAWLDKLNISGNVASSDEVTSIQNNTTTSLIAPSNIIRPASGTLTAKIVVYLTDEVGNMEAPDSAPTLSVYNSTGTNLSARLASTTGSLTATGVYTWVYTSTSTDDTEELLFTVTVIEGGQTRYKGATSWITDNVSTDFTSSDRDALNSIASKLPVNNIADQTLLETAIGSPMQSGGVIDSNVVEWLGSGVHSSDGTSLPLVVTKGWQDSNDSEIAVTHSSGLLSTMVLSGGEGYYEEIEVHFQDWLNRIDENVSSPKSLTSDYDAAKLAASQESVDDIPTSSEMTTALSESDDAVLARLGTPTGVSIAADIAAISAGGATAEEIDELLTANHGAGNWAHSTGGSGARTITINVDDGDLPIENAIVRLTNGASTFTKYTDASGVAVFHVDDATWSVVVTRVNHYSPISDSIVVDDDKTETYSLNQLSLEASDPGYTTGHFTAIGASGLPAQSASFTIKHSGMTDQGSGFSYTAATRTASSDSDGLVQFSNLIKGGIYQLYRGSDSPGYTTFKVPLTAGDSFLIPSFF